MMTYSRSQVLNIKEKIIIPQLDEDLLNRFLSIQKNVQNSIKVRYNKYKKYPPINNSNNNTYVNTWRKKSKKVFKKKMTKLETLQGDLIIELNKLTKINYKKISSNIIKLIEQDESLVTYLLQNLFIKAIIQEQYCYLYAKLCFTLHQYPIYKETVQEFINNQYEHILETFTKKTSIIAKTEKMTEYDLFCIKMKEKKKSIGCFQFTAELYKLNLLSKSKLEPVISHLLQELITTEDKQIKGKKVECVCCIFKTVGYKLEISLGKVEFNKKYTKILESYSKNKDIFSSRIRFLIMDSIDRKGWGY